MRLSIIVELIGLAVGAAGFVVLIISREPLGVVMIVGGSLLFSMGSGYLAKVRHRNCEAQHDAPVPPTPQQANEKAPAVRR